MIDWPPDDDKAEDRLPELSAMLAELATADAPRRRELLTEIMHLTWEIGSSAAVAIPVLIDWPLDGERETEERVCHALSNCAPAGVAPLLELLEHPSELARLRACSALLRVGQGANNRVIPAADALLTRLEDVSDVVRIEAAFALGQLEDHRKATVARLVEVARTGSASTRASALHAIGNICHKRAEEEPGRQGPPFAGTADVVLAAIDDADEDVRKSAWHALGYLRLPASEHLEHVLRILETDPSGVVRGRAASQLPELAERADMSSAAATLARLLGTASVLPSPSSSQHSVARPIIVALGKIGPGARAAVPALLQALNNDWTALPAAEALWRITRRADLVLPTLERELDGNGELVCDLLCEMGPEARPLLPKVLDALARDDYWDFQWAATDAIGCIASADPETLQALRNALMHESGIVRSSATRGLANIGAPAVPILLDMLTTDTDAKTQEWVADALARMGPAAISAAPMLRAKLASPHRGLRVWAAIGLGMVASDADVVPVLIEILEDDGVTDAWQAACEALAAIGAPAAASREHLVALASCPIDEIRQAAEVALAAINRPPS
jgi:HEAT repeat protein